VSTPARALRRPPPPRLRLPWRGLVHSMAFRGLLLQVLLVGGILALGAWMIGNAQEAMAKRGIATGFSFLGNQAGFTIGESLIPFSSTDSFLRAYGVAILNTLKVSVLAIVGATVLGVMLGIARLSSNWLMAKLASVYVEVFRNTPQLVQIIFWYVLITRLPPPRLALSFLEAGYLSNRGLVLPWPEPHLAWDLALVALIAAPFLAWACARRAKRAGALAALIVPGLPLVVWGLAGAPLAFDMPLLRGFNIQGGVTLSPEFLALLLGLSLYIAAFIAEIVRSGIQSVPRGQVEAARAIGLRPSQIYRKVTLPQAMRVIVPPAAAQYVSTTKNSSLGVAIGYPELFSVNNTIITISGNTIEAITIMMAVYLSISFAIAALMNWYNHLVRIRER
jgi:general L-amino acid transport system permease protein